MSAVWRVCERAELGQVGRQWELEKTRPLSIGRSTESDIQVSSKSVENQHAVFEWNTKMVAFTVRDLGSINGTYINNRPISRGGRGMLNHGDVVRLGYEKSQVFRIEERFPSPANSPAKTAMAAPHQNTPQPTHSSPAHKDAMTTNTNIYNSNTPPFPATVASPGSQQQFIGQSQHQPQAVVVHNVPTYVQQQSPVPFVMPQYGYPPSPPVSLHPTPLGHVTIPHAASSAFSPITPAHFLHLSTPPPMSSSSGSPPISVEDLELSLDNTSSTKPQRSDGRRAVELSNSPNLSKVSKLYGKPAWWGEEKATEKDNDQEFEFVKPGSQILRDYDRRVRSPSNCEDTSAARPQRLSASEDLRVQAMSNSRERECTSPASTWTVDFGDNTLAVATKKRPSRFDNVERRPRSADPSPNRSPQIKKDLLPVTASSSLKRSSSTHRSPSSSPRRSPVMTRRPQGTIIKKKTDGASTTSESSSEQAFSRSKTITKKPPTYASASLTRSKTTVKKTNPTGAGGRVRRSSLEKVTQATSGKSATTKQVCVSKEVSNKSSAASLNDTYVTDPLSSSLDESQSQSDASLSSSGQPVRTPAGQKATAAGMKSSNSTSKVQQRSGEVGGGEEVSVGGSRPNSARKQWASDQSQVPADGLMLASIEARIRRLSKLAHSCSRQLSCLQRSLGDVPGIIVHNIPPTSPMGSQRGSDQRLPEWRFNKEGDSIFRGMRTVEKWLKDIEATVKSIEIGGAGDEGGVASCCDKESTDYQAEYEATELESEVEAILMQDSMEDEFYSFSDTEETT